METDPLVGMTLADRYAIEECIGEGGMGRVYRARHNRMGRRFAIKVLFGDYSTDDRIVSRFAREAAAAGRLNHRNVVSVVDFGECDSGLLFLAMEYVAGSNLSDVLHGGQPLEHERIISLMIQLCFGLAHAHGKGLVHRDFKTDNILIGTDDAGEVARIVDFGIAMLSEPGEGDSRLTTQGVIVGTPAYMSPEQAIGDPLDHRTDLFSLGLVLYEMLAGVMPFGGSPMGIMRSNLALEPPPISKRVPGLTVDPELEALAMELMAKEPDDRPADAIEVARRLEAIRDGAPSTFGRTVTGASERRALDASMDVGVEIDVDTRTGFHTSARHEVGVPSANSEQVVSIRRSSTRTWTIIAFMLLLGLAAALLLTIGSESGTTDDSSDQPLASSTPGERGASVDGENQSDTSSADKTSQASDPATNTTAAHADRRLSSGKPDAAHASRRTDKARTKSKSKRKAKTSRRTRRDKRSTTGASSKPPAVAPKEVSTKAFTSRYKAVGRALDKLVQKRGEQSSSALLNRYFAISYMDAIRDSGIRVSADATLKKLQRDIARAMK